MKKYILSIVFLALLFVACEENMPEIACLSCEDETIIFDPQDKRVLIEEFTGVKCINCPAGSAELENLLDFFDGGLVAVSIHAGFFAEPYPESQIDFRTPEGEFINNLLGLPEAYPSAVVDRKQFSGENDLQLVGQASWAGRIAQQLEETAKVSVEFNNSYDSNSRVLTVNVSGGVFEDVNEEVRLTVMIVENGVVDAQLTPESSPDRDVNYVHKHVMRKVITAFDGDPLAASLTVGDTYEVSYSYTLPTEWNAANCEVVAFAHLAGQDNKEVLQVADETIAD